MEVRAAKCAVAAPSFQRSQTIATGEGCRDLLVGVDRETASGPFAELQHCCFHYERFRPRIEPRHLLPRASVARDSPVVVLERGQWLFRRYPRTRRSGVFRGKLWGT